MNPPSFSAAPMLALMLREQGRTYFSKGLFGQAAGMVFQALALDPASAESAEMLVAILIEQADSDTRRGLLSEAEIALRRALMMHPESTQARAALAQLLGEDRPQDSFAALYDQALHHLEAGQLAQAELALRRAIMARPDLAPAKVALSIVLYQQALPLHGAKRLLEAEANMWEALALRPDFAEAAHFLAVSSRHPSRVLPDVPDPQATSAAREALSLLQIADVVDGTLIRVGQRADGGYVMLDQGLTEAVAYSLGIGGNISWDEAMAERGCRLFQYDHSIEKVPKEHPNFHWFRLGVTGQEGGGGPFMTLVQMLANNGHLGRRDLILKTDIEGAEWDMLIHLADDVLQQFSQITGEFHDFVGIGNPDRRDKILAGLRRLTKFHQVIHVHANSVGTIGIIGGVPLADLLEITLVRRADHVFLPTTKRFPTALDAPNSPGQLDYALDLLGFSGGSVFDA